MILSRRVALNNVYLDEQDPRIVIRSVKPGTPKETISAVSKFGGYGQRISSHHYDMLETVVTWAMDIPKRELAERRSVWDKVAAWAMKTGWLETSEAPEKQMYVDHTVLDSHGDLWDWTGDYTITFRSYHVPFWQAKQESSLVVYTGNNVITVPEFDVPGNIETVFDVTVADRSGMENNNITVQTGGSKLEFSGLNMGGGGIMEINHGTDGILRVYNAAIDGNPSMMDKMKLSSDDDLYVSPGKNVLKITADRGVWVSFRCRGRWL